MKYYLLGLDRFLPVGLVAVVRFECPVGAIADTEDIAATEVEDLLVADSIVAAAERVLAVDLYRDNKKTNEIRMGS